MGPILVLLTPTVLDEVDAKKRDGRLGTRARDFNRLISPAATSGQPVLLKDGVPTVHLALAICERIPWNKYDDLDPQDADSRVVAEAIHTKSVLESQKILASHDIKPISMASRYGIKVLHVSDTWLRPKEPSPSDKEVQRLKQRVAELEKTEPELEISVSLEANAPIQIHAISELNSDERAALSGAILLRNPKPKRPNAFAFQQSMSAWNDDYVSDEDYAAFAEKVVPQFVDSYPKLLEQMYGQVPIKITVKNRGNIQAENLIIKVRILSGWLNQKIIVFPYRGPSLPRRRLFDPLRSLSTVPMAWKAGKHDMHIAVEPERNPFMEVHCEDFRHGTEWTFDGVLWLDPTDQEACTVSVSLTAANMHGEVVENICVEKSVSETRAKDLIDLKSGCFLKQPIVQNRIEDAFGRKEFKELEFYKDENG